MTHDRLYADHNATTALDPEAAEVMHRASIEAYGNPNSLHREGVAAARRVKEARVEVAALVGARASEIAFTGGGTESDIAALWSMIAVLRKKEHQKIPVIAYLTVEHPAIVQAIAQYEALGLARGIAVEVDEFGGIDGVSLREAAARADGLCAMWANNETGALIDRALVADVVEREGILWHCDAVQAAGKVPIDLSKGPGRAISTLALAAHKLYGPKGVGALFVRRGTDFAPLMPGGAQEKGRRSGTLNTPGIAAFGIAARSARQRLEGEHYSAPIAALRDALEAALIDRLPGSEVNGPRGARLPNTLNISLRRADGQWADGEAVLLGLNERGIAISTGAACSAGSRAPSRILTAMGLTPARASASVRVSLGPEHRAADIDRLTEALVECAG